jgi:SAM-dependent methyltransferase
MISHPTSRVHNSSDYRDRLYRTYVNTRRTALAPTSVEDLGSRAAHLNRLIKRHFPKDRDATIVDLGCGYGALIYFARLAGYRNIQGVDRSPEQVEVATRLGIEGVRESDLRDSLFVMSDASCDLVVTFDVIEHFRKEELLRFVDEVFRVLRVDGRWIIHAPNGESPFGSRMRYWDFTHEIAFTRESISQLLLSAGFARVDCYEDSPVPHGPVSGARFLLWKALRAALLVWLAVETGDYAPGAILSQNLFAVAEKTANTGVEMV